MRRERFGDLVVEHADDFRQDQNPRAVPQLVIQMPDQVAGMRERTGRTALYPCRG